MERFQYKELNVDPRSLVLMIGFLVLLVAFNGHLWGREFFLGPFTPPMKGWISTLTIITHALVHVSWYHLILDASAFVMLYVMLKGSTRRKLLYVLITIAGGALFPMLFPESGIYRYGISGLSAASHGLMAVVGAQYVISPSDHEQYVIGVISLGSVALKSLVELYTGQVVFSVFHFGQVGTPIAESHLGGVLAGVMVVGLLYIRNEFPILGYRDR
ncbi:MAG: rhomboid family intramembrane serine protease [bacterium]